MELFLNLAGTDIEFIPKQERGETEDTTYKVQIVQDQTSFLMRPPRIPSSQSTEA